MYGCAKKYCSGVGLNFIVRKLSRIHFLYDRIKTFFRYDLEPASRQNSTAMLCQLWIRKVSAQFRTHFMYPAFSFRSQIGAGVAQAAVIRSLASGVEHSELRIACCQFFKSPSCLD